MLLFAGLCACGATPESEAQESAASVESSGPGEAEEFEELLSYLSQGTVCDSCGACGAPDAGQGAKFSLDQAQVGGRAEGDTMAPLLEAKVVHEDRIQWLNQRVEERRERRRELSFVAAKTPNWELNETEHYFVLSSIEDEELLRQIARRLEALRARLIREYPPITPIGGPNLPSMTCVRVFKSRAEFLSYGGPGGSSGTYSLRNRELGFYVEGFENKRQVLWSTIQQLVAFEHLEETLGLADPKLPLWVIYGVPAFYGGLSLGPDGRFLLLPDQDRLEKVLGIYRAGELMPLGELLRLSASRLQTPNHIDQAWSFVYFLRVGSEQSPLWFDSWDGILDRYLEASVEGASRESALEAALRGVDLISLDAVWRQWLAHQRS